MVLTAGPVYFGGANLQIHQQGYNHMRNEQDSEERNRSMPVLFEQHQQHQHQHQQGGRMSLPGGYHANQPMLLTPEMQMEQRLAAQKTEHQMSAPVSQAMMVDSKSFLPPTSGGEYVISEGTVYLPQYHQPGQLGSHNGFAEMNGNGVSEAEREIKECIDKFGLRDDQARRDIAVKDLRHVIPMLIIFCFGGKGEPSQKKVKGLWDRPPTNWPAGVPYLDPNNAQKSKGEMCKPKKETLMKMFNFLMQTYWDMQRRRGSSSTSGSMSPASGSPLQESKYMPVSSPPSEYMYQGSVAGPSVECNGNLPYASMPTSPEQHIPLRTSPELSLQPQPVTSYSTTNPGTRYTVRRVGQDVTNGNGMIQAPKRWTTAENGVMVKDEACHQQQVLQQQQQFQMQQQQQQQQQQSQWAPENHTIVANTPSPPSQRSGMRPASPASCHSSDSIDSICGSPPHSSTASSASSTTSSGFSKKHRILKRTQSQSAPDGAPQNLMNGFSSMDSPSSQMYEDQEPMDMSSTPVVIAPISPSSSSSSSSPPAADPVPVPQYAGQGWNPIVEIMNRIEMKMSQVKENRELLEAEAKIGLLCIIKDLLWKMRPVLKDSSEQEQNFLEKLHDFECTLDVVQQFRSMPQAHHNKWQEFQDCRGEFYKPGWPGQKELIIAPGLHSVSHEEVVATEEHDVLKDAPSVEKMIRNKTELGLAEEERRVKGLVPVPSSSTQVKEIGGKQLQLFIREGDQMKACTVLQLMKKLNIAVKERPNTAALQDHQLKPKEVDMKRIAQDHSYNISEESQQRKSKKGARYQQGHQNVGTPAPARKDVENESKDAERLVRDGGDSGLLAHEDGIVSNQKGPDDSCSSSGDMDCAPPDPLDPFAHLDARSFLDLIDNPDQNFDDLLGFSLEVEANDGPSFETGNLTDLDKDMKTLELSEGSPSSTNGHDPLWSQRGHGGHGCHGTKFLPPSEPHNKIDEDDLFCAADIGTSLKTKTTAGFPNYADISDPSQADAFDVDGFEDTDLLKANIYSDSSALDVSLSLTEEKKSDSTPMAEVINEVVLCQMQDGAIFAETVVAATADVTTTVENQDHPSFCDSGQQIEEKAELVQGNLSGNEDMGKQLAALQEKLTALNPGNQEVENETSEDVLPDEADPLGSIPTVVADLEEQCNSDSDDEGKGKRRSKKRKRKH